ncbi:MAG TPA: sugar ABC transporter permease [Paenibacillus sp.]|nr:sugar ABC transporter permease [Paenibacillus sp.]
MLPLLSSVAISMTDLSFISNVSDVRFVGADHFLRMWDDERFVDSLGRSFWFTALYVPTVIVASLAVAFLINARIRFKHAVRTAIFLPYVSNFVAIAVVWAMLLDVRDGPVNATLLALGVETPPLWLLAPDSVIPTIVLILSWQNIGFFMIVYLAALQDVPREMYEAATMDGATGFQKLRWITLPSISPTTFLLVITAVINSFQNFGPIQVLTKGGPGQASTTLSVNIYQETFVNYRIGYSTAQAIVLFLIILAITAIQWRGQKKWVSYES